MKKIFGHWIVKNLLIAGIIFIVLLLGAMLGLNILTQHNREYTVPDLTGVSVQEAETIAQKEGMRVEVIDSVFVNRLKRGSVYRQNPPAGNKVKKGRRISLTINALTAKKVTMPNLIGYSMRQAKAELASRGLRLGRLIYVNDIATNNVLKQHYKGQAIAAGSPIDSESIIDLIVGLNSTDNTTFIPNVEGLKNYAAVDAIHDNSLNIRSLHFDSSVKTYLDTLNAVVYKQSPLPSQYPCRMGTEVKLYLTIKK